RRNGFLSATQKPKKVIPMDLWLRFVGYAISEGDICLRPDKKTPCSFSITQRIVHPDEVKEIRAILNQLPFKCKECFNPKTGDYNWKVHDIQLYTWLAEHTGIFCDEKKIPRAFLSLSSRQLRLLFSTLMKGDGYWDPRYKNNGGYYTTSKRLADDVQELCLKIGLCTKVSLKSPAAGNRKDRWVVSISSGRMIELNSRRNIQTKHYKGRCYCFSVPSGFFITERNGCIAIQGNSGIRCFTVLTLGGYCGKNKFNIFYIHRFTGEDVDPERQLPQIIETLKQYNVKIVGADEGFGFASNDRLIRTFGPDRIQKYRYNKQKALIEWDSTGHWWQMDRSQIMSLFMRKLIDGNLIELPRAEEFHPEFGQDVLNIVSEFDEKRDRMTYTHHPKRPDDVFHSMLYCFLAMSILQPRPDIFRPQRGDA
ncbi:MAG: hypothetical protein KKB59_19140, partial [Spirochaetes bacterium]|nr:hypothetical protein [Spirochaetota bacterium]